MSEDDRGRQEELLDRVREMSPSAKLVFYVLREEGELTQRELHEHTRLPPRTIRYALDQLQEANLVISQTHLLDARKSMYSLVLPIQEPRFQEEEQQPRRWERSSELDAGELEGLDP